MHRSDPYCLTILSSAVPICLRTASDRILVFSLRFFTEHIDLHVCGWPRQDILPIVDEHDAVGIGVRLIIVRQSYQGHAEN